MIDTEAAANSIAEGEQAGDEVGFRIRIGKTNAPVTAPLMLDIGNSGLGLDVSGDVSIDTGYGFEMIVGTAQQGGAFVEFGTGDDIFVDFDASIDDLNADARLGPLAVSVSTIDASALGSTQRRRARIDPADVSTEAVNGVLGRIGLDLPNGRYSLSTIGSALSNADFGADVVGSLSVLVNTGINTTLEGIPSIEANLHINFDRSTTTIADAISSFATPHVSITDAYLDLGSFVSDVLRPILTPINRFLDPIRPVLTQLTTPIPVLSDLIGPTTYVDLIRLFGNGGETVARFVDAVSQIATLINIPGTGANDDPDSSLRLPLGSFTTDLVGGILRPQAVTGGSNFDDFVSDSTQGFDAMREYLRNIP